MLYHLHQAAKILKDHTEPDKLKDFESIEVELRTQMLTLVCHTVAEIFLTQHHPTPSKRRASSIELPTAQAERDSEGMSVDGGKVCLRTEEGGQWRDYKLVSLHRTMCEAFFQDPDGLKA